MLTGAQLRAARGLLNLSVAELAEQTGLAINTIRRAERANGLVPISIASAKLLLATLQKGGVVFLEANSMGPGVRLNASDPLPDRPRRRP